MYISESSPTNIQNLILDNWADVYSRVICIAHSSSKPVFISNIIGSTNGDTTHYGIYEYFAITEHTLQYNFFVSGALGFLYRNDTPDEATNDIDVLNDGGTWTGATGGGGATGNTNILYADVMGIWDSWQN